ncbi:MAG: ABC-type transport auxiliary lipoprotein family protein [Legionella sp.]|nr:ABC-type transport auxiliary lipoprotein family protein [Legionella sp.]
MACSPVKTVVTNQYKLDAFSEKRLSNTLTRQSILITQPEAVAGYQTNEMVYVKKLFELNNFAHSAWVSPPADMLYPLIVQSVQRSGFFYAVASSTHSEQTDYRLDTQLIKLQQNFLTRPSTIDFVVKAVLTNSQDNRVVASRMINQHIRCPLENPYGGVLAANIATRQFTAELSSFIVDHVKRDKH